MTVPDYQSLMLPVLKASSQGEIRIGEAVDHLAGELGLTEEDRTALLPSGRQPIIYNRVQWAKTYLAKAGLVEATRRGHFKITERGKEVLAQSPERIDNTYLSQFEEFQEFRSRSSVAIETTEDLTGSPVDDRTPDETIRAAHKEIEQALRQELLNRVLAAPPDFFERLILSLLVEMGYGGSVEEASRPLGKSGDDGVDGVIDQDALGLDRVYVQAKRYAPGNNIGSPQIRDFFGSLDRFKAAKGLFVTTSGFSSSAKNTAAQLSKRIVLIDGDQLSGLMVRYNVGCRLEDTLYLKKIDEDFFLD